MNAKKEFLEEIKDKEVLCAIIGKEDEPKSLSIGFNNQDFDKFLNEIDFDYDEGFGGQNLFGNIWFKDRTWSERVEYDGSEWWEYKLVPEIPLGLRVKK